MCIRDSPDAAGAFDQRAAHGDLRRSVGGIHALNGDATADRVGWLVDRLGLSPIGAGVLDEVGLPDQPSSF